MIWLFGTISKKSTVNPLYGALRSAMMVAGKDDFCMNYITAFREGRLE